MKKSFLAVSFLLVAILLSGCITQIVDSSYSNNLGNETSSVAGNESSDSPASHTCPDGSVVDSSDYCPADENPESPENPEPRAPVECGSVPIEVLVTGQLDEAQAAAADCFNSALAGCSPSKFVLTGILGGTFTIEGVRGQECVISYYDDTDKVEKECGFTLPYVRSVSEASANAGASYLSVILIAGSISNEEVQDPASGQTSPISCTKN